MAICVLLAACEGGVGNDGEDTDAAMTPSTRDDGAVESGADAGTDARTATRDAEADANEPVEMRDADAARDARADQGEPDATTSRDAATQDADAMPDPERKPVFVAVGYSGARFVSRDLGLTWTRTAPLVGGGDDGNLLRSVTYGNGMFVAVGSKIWTTTDGMNWTERTNPAGQWFGGVEYGVPTGQTTGIFVAAGGWGTSVYSSNGTDWSAGQARGTEAARTVAFGNGQFMCATDAKKWWRTTNGNNWMVQPETHGGSQVMWCGDEFTEVSACSSPLAHANARTAVGEGVYISAAGHKIERSTDGKTWTMVKDTTDSPVEDVAFGYLD